MTAIFDMYMNEAYTLDYIINELDLILDEIGTFNTISINEINFKTTLSNIWSNILRVVEKVKEAFTKIVDTIKTGIVNLRQARIPKKKQIDIEYCLMILESRTIDDSDRMITKFIEAYKMGVNVNTLTVPPYKKDGADLIDHSMIHEIDKIRIDISESINALHNSQQYKALIDNKYINNDIVSLDSSTISSDITKSKAQIKVFEYNIKEINMFTKNMNTNDSNTTELVMKVSELCYKEIDYYKERITLLRYFFSGISINSISSGIGPKLKLNLLSTMYLYHYEYDKNIVAEALSIMDQLKSLNSAKRFNEYRFLHTKLTSILKLPTHSLVGFDPDIKENTNDVKVFLYLASNYEKIPVGNRYLYHQGNSESLTELEPNAVIGDRLFCPEPRIYVNINFPLNRFHRALGKNLYGRLPDISESEKLYRIDQPINFVYQDTEIKGLASFIVSDKPIKVTKINYEQWKKENNVDDIK